MEFADVSPSLLQLLTVEVPPVLHALIKQRVFEVMIGSTCIVSLEELDYEICLAFLNQSLNEGSQLFNGLLVLVLGYISDDDFQAPFEELLALQSI